MKSLLFCSVFPIAICLKAGAQPLLDKDSLLEKIGTMKEDSLKVRSYYLLSQQYFKDDLNESEKYCLAGGRLSMKIKYTQGLFNYYTKYATLLNFKGHFDSALNIDLEALAYARKITDSVEIGRTMINVGMAYRQLENYEGAVNYIEGAKNILSRHGAHQYDGGIYDLLQLLYNSMHLYRKAVDNGLLAIEVTEKEGNKDLLQQVCNNLGLNYISLREYDSSRFYLNWAETLAIETGDRVIQISTNLNYGLLSIYQEHYDSVEIYAKKALDLAHRYNTNEYIGWAHYGLAYYHLQKKEYTNARIHGDSAMLLAERYNMRGLQQKVYALLSNLYYGMQDTRQGWQYSNQFELLSDSLLNESVTRSTVHFEKLFEAERRDTKIKLQQDQITQKTILNYFLIAGAAALFIILLLSYRNYRNRQKLQQVKIDELETEKKLTATEAVLKGEEQERIRLAKDLHDGLGGMLSGIKYSLNNLKGNLVMAPDNVQAFERSIDMLDSSINEMRRVAHNMMPETLVKYGLDTALKEFCGEIGRSGVLQMEYQSVGMHGPDIEQTTAVTIYRIVQELVNNTIKHAQAKNVLVQLHQFAQEKLLAVTIEDDGKGFDTRILGQSDGIGWRSIQNRVEFLKGKIDIQSSAEGGTSVMIEISI